MFLFSKDVTFELLWCLCCAALWAGLFGVDLLPKADLDLNPEFMLTVRGLEVQELLNIEK